MRNKRWWKLVAALGIVSLGLAACGDDDDGDSAEAIQEYCDFSAAMDEQDGPPTEDQLNEIKDLAPAAIKDDITFVADKFIEAGDNIGAAFSDPEVNEAFGRIEEFEAQAPPEGCGAEQEEEEEQETEPAEGANVVEVTGVDFAFEGVPDEIPAGLTSFGFTNGGESAHEMIILKLGEGADLDALLAADEEPAEDEASDVGAVFGQPDEGTFYATADLDEGTYALVCFIPGPEGKAHHELGMKTTFTVSAA